MEVSQDVVTSEKRKGWCMSRMRAITRKMGFFPSFVKLGTVYSLRNRVVDIAGSNS